MLPAILVYYTCTRIAGLAAISSLFFDKEEQEQLVAFLIMPGIGEVFLLALLALCCLGGR